MRRELQLVAKRIMDLMLAIVGLTIVASLLLVKVSAVAIKLGSRGPVFFRLHVAGITREGPRSMEIANDGRYR
jgi:lipopolysaccharide/colanic/teichoic acid biosynthesis glycosyltransferase